LVTAIGATKPTRRAITCDDGLEELPDVLERALAQLRRADAPTLEMR